MRTLKYAILGLLSQQPMSGYDIAQEFKVKAFANFWYATHSQIYPELKKLLEEGLVTNEIVIEVKILEKKIYHITEAGREDFQNWLFEDEPIPVTPKDIFRLKTYFSQFVEKDEFIRLLNQEIEKHQFKYNFLRNIMERNYNFRHPELGTKEMGDFMVLEGALIRESTYIAWLARCLTYYGEEVEPQLLDGMDLCSYE